MCSRNNVTCQIAAVGYSAELGDVEAEELLAGARPTQSQLYEPVHAYFRNLLDCRLEFLGCSFVQDRIGALLLWHSHACGECTKALLLSCQQLDLECRACPSKRAEALAATLNASC